MKYKGRHYTIVVKEVFSPSTGGVIDVTTRYEDTDRRTVVLRTHGTNSGRTMYTIQVTENREIREITHKKGRKRVHRVQIQCLSTEIPCLSPC